MKKLILIIFLLTINCSNNKVVKSHGSTGLELKNDKIEVLKSNKNDVLTILGNPSTVSLFDENSWIFIERKKTNQSVFKLGKSKINENNILEITFNNYGVVKAKKFYNLDNMNNLKKVKSTTMKKYDSSSPIGKLLKSIEQKMNVPTQSKRNKN